MPFETINQLFQLLDAVGDPKIRLLQVPWGPGSTA
jgi:hypothetical protein